MPDEENVVRPRGGKLATMGWSAFPVMDEAHKVRHGVGNGANDETVSVLRFFPLTLGELAVMSRAFSQGGDSQVLVADLAKPKTAEPQLPRQSRLGFDTYLFPS